MTRTVYLTRYCEAEDFTGLDSGAIAAKISEAASEFGGSEVSVVVIEPKGNPAHASLCIQDASGEVRECRHHVITVADGVVYDVILGFIAMPLNDYFRKQVVPHTKMFRFDCKLSVNVPAVASAFEEDVGAHYFVSTYDGKSAAGYFQHLAQEFGRTPTLSQARVVVQQHPEITTSYQMLHAADELLKELDGDL